MFEEGAGGLLTALLVFVSLLTATAAVPEMPRFRVLDATSGLPSNVVRAMLQDAAGYLWLATSDGLARYDGTAFRCGGMILMIQAHCRATPSWLCILMYRIGFGCCLRMQGLL